MGGRELVQRFLIARLSPARGQRPLFLAFEERRRHGGPDELTANSGVLGHSVLPMMFKVVYGRARDPDHAGSGVNARSCLQGCGIRLAACRSG